MLLLLLAASGARAQDTDFPRDQVQAVLAVAFEAVLERHLESVVPADLGLWSLRGLEVLDPSLQAELRGGALLLSNADRLLAARPVPPPGAPPEAAARPLAVALTALIEVGWEASPPLRRAGAERLLRSAFEELVTAQVDDGERLPDHHKALLPRYPLWRAQGPFCMAGCERLCGHQRHFSGSKPPVGRVLRGYLGSYHKAKHDR